VGLLPLFQGLNVAQDPRILLVSGQRLRQLKLVRQVRQRRRPPPLLLVGQRQPLRPLLAQRVELEHALLQRVEVLRVALQQRVNAGLAAGALLK
jgi:hypothetical protein